MALYDFGYKDILSYISSERVSGGVHTIKYGEEEIDIECRIFKQDVNYTQSPVLGSDVPDKEMLVLKYKGDLTVGESVLMTPQVRKKGMFILVEGDLTVKGTISMTARGAIAAGQNVDIAFLDDGTIARVPAVGAQGGAGHNNGNAGLHGNKGIDGNDRSTGGGGGGGLRSFGGGGNKYSGAGGIGTSFSGGAGGGGAAYHNWDGTAGGRDGSDEGGEGGRSFSNHRCSSGGGAGNPGGWGQRSNETGGVLNNQSGQDGTGGLLIIAVRGNFTVNQGGVIESRGNNGGNALASAYSGSYGSAGGGASGGGSINIFYSSSYLNEGTISASGGKGGTGAHVRGGDGGDGSVTIQQISFPSSNTLNVEIDNKDYDLTINIYDNENDPFAYKVTLNDNIIFPYDGKDMGYSDKAITLYKKLDNSDLIFGEGNVIKVVAVDKYGMQAENTLIIKGDYYGLLFADEDKEYYSTNLGEVLKRMRVTPLVAGEVAQAHKVLLINNQSAKVRNVNLRIDYSDEVPHTNLKLSKTEQPFIPQDELVWAEAEAQQELEFYVKIFTNKNAYGKGKFKLTARAEFEEV